MVDLAVWRDVEVNLYSAKGYFVAIPRRELFPDDINVCAKLLFVVFERDVRRSRPYTLARRQRCQDHNHQYPELHNATRDKVRGGS